MKTEYRLDELFNLQMGKTPARKNPDYWNTKDHKWISIADLSNCGKFIYNTKEYLSDKAVKESGISLIPAHTVLMSFKLSIGKTAITPEPMYSNEAIMSFRDKHVVDLLPDYLYYLFSNFDWEAGTNKAVMGKTLNKTTLSATRVRIHDIQEQKSIVELLDKVKAVLEIRKEELAKLDELIKARFVELFGDETNPLGWQMINVEEVADVSVGVVIKPAQYYTDAEHGVKAFRSLNIGPNMIKDSDWVYFSKEGNEKNSKSQLRENDLLIVRSGTPGTACVVPREYEGCNAIDIIIARPDVKQVNPLFLCAYTNMLHGKRQIREGVGGAAQQHFNVGKYKKLKLMLLPKSKQDQFVDIVKQVDKSKVS